LQHKVSYTTTIAGAEATCLALKHQDAVSVHSLQDLHRPTGA
jgi:carbamoyl-phosphate synthase large subunit